MDIAVPKTTYSKTSRDTGGLMPTSVPWMHLLVPISIERELASIRGRQLMDRKVVSWSFI